MSKKKPAKQPLRKEQQPSKKGHALKVFFYTVLVVGLTIVFKYAMLLVLLGLLPTFVALYADTTNEGFHARVVGLCNMAGVLPFLGELWVAGITADSVTATIGTPHVWLVMYGAAAFGWGVVWFFPQAMEMTLGIVNRNGIHKLQKRQQEIVDEWGIEVEKTSQRVVRNAQFRGEHKKK